MKIKNPMIKAACSLSILLSIAFLTKGQSIKEIRAFEVSACNPSKGEIITAWMEKRPMPGFDTLNPILKKMAMMDATGCRVAYKSSIDNGTHWTDKGTIDLKGSRALGNPFVAANGKGDVYLTCMTINGYLAGFSGNISLYAFNVKSRQFDLRSVPNSSDSCLLDKPAIISFGSEIHLVYVSYTRKMQSIVKYQMSKDKGKTWTEPVNVFSDSSVRYLGASIALLPSNQIAIASGSYGGRGVYFVKRKMKTDSIVFEKPVIVSKVSPKLMLAMTEMSAVGNKVMLTWQYPHEINETWLAFSTDKGDTWANPLRINTEGNLLSASFDKGGNIHCIYADFSHQKYFVNYKEFDANYKVLKDYQLIDYDSFKEKPYIGAYQKLLNTGDELFAFWIDYPNSTLNLKRWKI